MRDAHGRQIDYIRLSVTDRCNLRCTYCMAEEMEFLPRRDLLTFEEIETLARHLVVRGVRRIRLTGGEPLVRKGVLELVQRLARLRTHGLDELTLTTNGTRLPEMAQDLFDAGVRRIVLGLGGSATNDGGAGLLAALGVRFLDRAGQELALGGAALASLSQIDLTGLDTRLAQVEVMVAADVDNPLCGPRGASAVFGPQKGASPAQVEQLDAALAHYADVMAATLGEDLRDYPGVGAAGGLGFAARAVLRAAFRPGVELVAELSGLAAAVERADLVITGEGRLDGQSLHGKTPVGVARIARAAGVPVIALAGSLGEGYQRLYAEGIGAAFSLAPGPLSLEQAMQQAADQLSARAADLARLWQIAGTAALRAR